MRADRLVAILLLLQNRGRVTASEVARELEVSERTARRDLEALGMAGLPIYSTQGRNGGWRLAGGGRTDLSGLTAAEAQALFLVAGPASATPEVKAALRKLVRALPEPFRLRAQAASSAVLVDPAGWDGSTTVRRTPPHLEAVQQAVIEGEQLVLGYTAATSPTAPAVVHPLGLAAKGSGWYLVADTDAGLRTFRVDRITSVERNGQAVRRPPDFDLANVWRLITAEIDQRRTPLRARVLASTEVVGWCRVTFGSRVRIGPAGPDGRVELELRGHHVRSLAAELAGFGGAVEVLEPDELRQQLALLGAADRRSISGHRLMTIRSLANAPMPTVPASISTVRVPSGDAETIVADTAGHDAGLLEEVQQAVRELEFLRDAHDREAIADRSRRQQARCPRLVVGARYRIAMGAGGGVVEDAHDGRFDDGRNDVFPLAASRCASAHDSRNTSVRNRSASR